MRSVAGVVVSVSLSLSGYGAELPVHTSNNLGLNVRGTQPWLSFLPNKGGCDGELYVIHFWWFLILSVCARACYVI